MGTDAKKPVRADAVNEMRERSRLEIEKKFVAKMRHQIYTLTDYDVEPNDSIYPLLACQLLLSEGTVKILRGHDLKNWDRIEARIVKTLESHYGKPGPNKMRVLLFGGCCLFGGLVIGVALGLFFRIMSL